MGVGDTVFALLRGCGLVGLVSCRPVVDVAFFIAGRFVLKDVCRVVIPFDDVQHASTLLG